MQERSPRLHPTKQRVVFNDARPQQSLELQNARVLGAGVEPQALEACEHAMDS